MNISIDTQPGRLSKEDNHAEFRKHLGINHDAFFEEYWAHPPRAWESIEELAKKLLLMKPKAIVCPHCRKDLPA